MIDCSVIAGTAPSLFPICAHLVDGADKLQRREQGDGAMCREPLNTPYTAQAQSTVSEG